MKFLFFKELFSSMIFIFLTNISIYNLNNNNISLIESSLITSIITYIWFNIFPKLNLNPCFSWNKWLYKEISFKEFLEIIFGQFIGSIISIGLSTLIIKYDYKNNYFLGFIDHKNSLLNILQIEIFGSFILTFFYEFIFNLVYFKNDISEENLENQIEFIQIKKKINFSEDFFPILFSIIYFLIHCSFLNISSCSLNPFKYLVVFLVHNYSNKNYLAYLISGFIGSILGKFIFNSFFLSNIITKEKKIKKMIFNN